MFTYDMITDIYPIAFAASRGNTTNPHLGTRKRRAKKSSTSSKRFQPNYLASPTAHTQDEYCTREYPDGPRLIDQYQQIEYPSSLESVNSTDTNFQQTVEIQVHQSDIDTGVTTDSGDDIIVSSDSSDCYQVDNDSASSVSSSPKLSSPKRQAHLTRSSPLYQSNRIRRSSCRRSKRSRNKSESWHERVADKFVKEAHAKDISDQQVVAYASTLLSQHIQTIKDEQLVLDWSQPIDKVWSLLKSYCIIS